MESTFNTKAIILNKYDFREADSRIIVFSEDFGKMSLVVRGGKKLKSKLAGHTEPLILSRLMVVRGKDFNYVGTAQGEEFYSDLKDDINKVFLAGEALNLVNKMTREGEVDGQKEVFNLLKKFLDNLENNQKNNTVSMNSCVIPAEAGIRGLGKINNILDSRLRGNDKLIDEFSQELTAILGFSQEDFEEIRRK